MANSQKTDGLDDFDLKILEALSEDGRMSVLQLSKKVGLSKTPCQTRLKRLVDEGYILGFRAMLNPQKLGVDHIAFAATDVDAVRKRLQANNISFREQIVPRTGDTQIFLYDPDGVGVELNFPKS